eukprot:13247877-Alexandrium_andersonii.AAC.1
MAISVCRDPLPLRAQMGTWLGAPIGSGWRWQRWCLRPRCSGVGVRRALGPPSSPLAARPPCCASQSLFRR